MGSPKIQRIFGEKGQQDVSRSGRIYSHTETEVLIGPWCRRRESNPHALRRPILSRLRLPFRHSGIFKE